MTGSGNTLKVGWGVAGEEEQECRGQSAVPSGRPVSLRRGCQGRLLQSSRTREEKVAESPALGTGDLGDLDESVILGELRCPPEGRERGNRGL